MHGNPCQGFEIELVMQPAKLGAAQGNPAVKSESEPESVENPGPAAQERPTLKTIAQISGLAVQTVSRALGDAPDISQKTKDRVRHIADEIGYVPNRAGVRLRTGKTNVISLVLATDHDAMNLTSRLISSIATGLRGTPYHLVVTPDFPDDDPMKPIRYIVQNGTADAIIINRIQPEDPRVRYLMDIGFPFVTHGRTIWSDQHAYYDYDNKAFGRLAVEALAKRGRKKLLLIAPPLDQNYALEIVAGATEAAQQAGIKLEIAQGIDSDGKRAVISSYIRDQILADPSYDALVSASPNATMAAAAGVEEAGKTIGEGFDIFSKETVPILSLFRPKILVAREDVAKAGAFLATAALKVISKTQPQQMQSLDRPEETSDRYL
jgi:LacI family transcriptional regulator